MFSIIKSVVEFRLLSLRGVRKATGEGHLICLVCHVKRMVRIAVESEITGRISLNCTPSLTIFLYRSNHAHPHHLVWRLRVAPVARVQRNTP